ncbi:DUF421 domain-containing protein [Piscinibacter sakaiensis]|uniref:DUF421 domain-containing protein n=1 Tax=Piscinibacter sakaiensis TaxID=1547922 RepID=UPI003AAE4493
MDHIFFDDWDKLNRTLIVGVLAYVLLVIFLRASGKRTLSKLNAFDLVVTVSFGSTLATILLNKDVTLAQGALALLLLITMQFLVTWSSVRWRSIKSVVSSEPSLLLYRGELLGDALHATRVTEDEVLAAVRGSGIAALDEVEAVVLETDGSLSVVRAPGAGNGSARSSLDPIAKP